MIMSCLVVIEKQIGIKYRRGSSSIYMVVELWQSIREIYEKFCFVFELYFETLIKRVIFYKLFVFLIFGIIANNQNKNLS